ncbi:MAG: cytochrome c [Planctomycetaceae bacterium]|nr:cytochrome c [Planctomycetaceae bacterium]
MATCRVIPLFLLFAAGCGSGQRPPQPEPTRTESTEANKPQTVTPAPAKIEKVASKHLPNPVRVHDKVISGGLPESDTAFAELKELGIKTVISVDGAKPDVATAQKYGLRYVHLPHSYDGIPEDRAQELAKAVRDLPGPIYVHCHHGKHRSPAAAAVACLGAGMIGHDEARQVLAIAGTGENYRGLFQSVDDAQPLGSALLDRLQAEFPATAKLPAMAEAMVAIEHVHDHLKFLEKAGWKAPVDQPALAPDHEALLLRESFTELLRTDELKGKPDRFQQLMQEAGMLSQSLEETLKSSLIDADAAAKKLAAVSANCKSCHQVYRDVPQTP